MHLAPGFETAAIAAAVLALVARAARAVTWDGAAAGLVTGVAVSAGFGPAGLLVLGTFFVVASAATRLGYARKAARGAAEARGGARGWRNVVGKGGVAAIVAVIVSVDPAPWCGAAFAGAVAAALADTLGTEIGTLSRGTPRALPSFRPVPTGTAGAVSIAGTLAAAGGAALVAAVAWLTGSGATSPRTAAAVAVAGLAASLVESLAVGTGLRAPGFLRNVLTTAAGAALAAAGAA